MVVGATSGRTPRSWERVRDELDARGGDLTGDELDRLADAAFWTDDHDRSIAIRREAYRAHVDAGAEREAAMSAWRLFYDHALIGEAAPAAGWLERCRRHVDRSNDDTSTGWLAIADADQALAAGDARLAAELGQRARSIGVDRVDPDLTAMGLQTEGRGLLALGDREAALSRLDEAMVSVVNDELEPVFVGWVFCNVVAACHAIADIRRASEWSDAAMRWCAALQEGKMYPGLCRVYSVEISFLRGDWDRALAQAELACAELTSFEPRYAGAAFGLVGDLRRVRGDVEGAEGAYRRAAELGVTALPGQALLDHARGRQSAALRSLRSAVADGSSALLPRALVLDALATVATAAGEEAEAKSALRELEAVADGTGGLLDAMASSATAELLHRDGRSGQAMAGLGRAVSDLEVMGFPYESARRRVRLAEMARSVGDGATADRELGLALEAFAALGAELDRAAAERLASDARPTCPLTRRELDVLDLVAHGRTNDEVAGDLVISRHTVARHMSNIRTKLGVTSRAAAVAQAIEHGWLAPNG